MISHTLFLTSLGAGKTKVLFESLLTQRYNSRCGGGILIKGYTWLDCTETSIMMVTCEIEPSRYIEEVYLETKWNLLIGCLG